MKKFMKKIISFKSVFFSVVFLCSFSASAQGLLTQNHAKTDKLDLSPYYNNYNPNLPSKYSLKEYAPEAGEQGNFGTCVGWSLACLQTMAKAIDGDWKNYEAIIMKHSYSPFFPYLKAKSYEDEDCKRGIELVNGLEVLSKFGNLKNEDFTHDCQKNISSKEQQKANKNRIRSYTKLFEEYDKKSQKIDAVKQAIYTKQPVVVGMFGITNSFKEISGKDFWQPTEEEIHQKNTEKTGHALVVIGYDDDKKNGSFLLFNSWGKTWGKDGMVWIAYNDFAEMCHEAYTIIPQKENEVKFSADLSFLGHENEKITFLPKDYIYKTSQAMYEGNSFQISLKINQPLYVYAFGADLTEKNAKIFPQNAHISPYFNDISQEIIFPKKDKHWVLDHVKGKDYVCVLLSNEPISFDAFLREVENTKGSFYEKIKTTLGDKFYPLNNNLSNKNLDAITIKQQILPHHKIMPLIVEIEHL